LNIGAPQSQPTSFDPSLVAQVLFVPNSSANVGATDASRLMVADTFLSSVSSPPIISEHRDSNGFGALGILALRQRSGISLLVGDASEGARDSVFVGINGGQRGVLTLGQGNRDMGVS
jgi:hypothetical protein